MWKTSEPTGGFVQKSPVSLPIIGYSAGESDGKSVENLRLSR